MDSLTLLLFDRLVDSIHGLYQIFHTHFPRHSSSLILTYSLIGQGRKDGVEETQEGDVYDGSGQKRRLYTTHFDAGGEMALS